MINQVLYDGQVPVSPFFCKQLLYVRLVLYSKNRQPMNTCKKGGGMKEILIFGGIIAVYFLMQLVILPKMGIST